MLAAAKGIAIGAAAGSVGAGTFPGFGAANLYDSTFYPKVAYTQVNALLSGH